MPPKRILLGVDPFAEDERLLEKQVEAVNALFEHQNVVIEPIYVTDPSMMSWSFLLEHEGFSGFESVIKETIRNRLSKISAPRDRLLPPVVIIAPSVTTGGRVATLLEHARNSDSDLIVVCSHSRKGLKRFYLGSFTEALSSRTEIPLLVINPRQQLRLSHFRRVLFPTDLSEESKAGLDRLCSTLAGMWDTIVLFHQVESFQYLRIDPFTAIPYPYTEIQKEWDRREEQLRQWVDELAAKGFNASYKMNRRPNPVAAAIRTAASLKKVGLIALVSEAGPLESVFLGSTTRKMIRGSFVPVWIVHVRPAKRSKTVGEEKRKAA